MNLFWTMAFPYLHRDMSHHCILVGLSSNRPLQWPSISTVSTPWFTRWTFIIVHVISFIKVRSWPVINVQHQLTQRSNSTMNGINVIKRIQGRVKWQIKWQVHTYRPEHMYERINMFIWVPYSHGWVFAQEHKHIHTRTDIYMCILFFVAFYGFTT